MRVFLLIAMGSGAGLMLSAMIDALASPTRPIPVQACETNEHPATVHRIIDGDTIEMDVYLGFDVSRRVTVRLKNIDTPEVFGANRDPVRGPKAADFTDSWASEHGPGFRLYEHGLGKYGRVIGEVCSDECLSDALRKAGHEK